jgi:SprT protein
MNKSRLITGLKARPIAQRPIKKAAPIVPPENPEKKNLGIGEIKTKTEAIIQDCLNRLGARWNRTFRMPKVDYFTLQGGVAGKAFYPQNIIQLNMQLLMRNWEEFQKTVIPHEVCHLIANTLYPRPMSHGREWQNLMMQLGCSPKPCHNYDTSAAKADVGKMTYKYECGCRTGTTADSPKLVRAISEKSHRQLVRNKTAYIRCNKCHFKLVCVDPLAQSKQQN